jgi:hypothetical protein
MRTRFADDILEGYNNVPLSKINEISDNELSYIFCDLCINKSTADSYKEDIKLWVSKLRKGGQINIVGVDLRCLCSEYLYSDDSDAFNLIIKDCNGLFTYKDIRSVLEECGLKIDSINLNNVYYNIMAIR